MARRDPSGNRGWTAPIATMGSVAILTFGGLFVFDHFVTGGPGGGGAGDPLTRYLRLDQDHITDAVSALGAMTAGVLGIVITVVSLLVQLSAGRYAAVARMFVRDRINIGVMGYYVVACSFGVLVSVSIQNDYVPRTTVLAMVVATMLALLLMAPYFAYVFTFLEPANIIARVRDEALGAFESGAADASPEVASRTQARVLQSLEELTDIVANSIEGKDKIIASGAVDAIKDFTVAYLSRKSSTPPRWFDFGEQIRLNPDVVALDPEARDELVARRTWVEWKAMRQFLGIYNEALATMPDINHLIAIDTRYIAEAATDHGDEEAILLTLRYMNSYLRATLNARNVRTAYNVLNQYRQLVVALMKAGLGRLAQTAMQHLRYYGHVSYDMKLPFVTETVAYDMGALCESAHEFELEEEDALLDEFLELDRATNGRAEEQSLKGVRKAQIKLAAYLLSVDDRERARRIYHDMEADPDERLLGIRDELMRVETKDFWEIIDRGRNFDYLPPDQKAAMQRFFACFRGIDSTADVPDDARVEEDA
jgi:hypothetical protein